MKNNLQTNVSKNNYKILFENKLYSKITNLKFKKFPLKKLCFRKKMSNTKNVLIG